MKKILITGGAGFIGINTVIHFAKKGYDITIFDNLSRKGTKKNLAFITHNFPKVKVVTADIRDADAIKKAARDQDIIIHLAGQVAVTTSVKDPREDFEINALGTFNLLEAARASGKKPIIVYSSTNKVYGGLETVKTKELASRYAFTTLKYGVSEDHNIDFHSPYGCSKGAADQYVRDYSRVYGLPTVVLRQSCIYGPFQFGIEDQGWVAWFMLAAVFGKKITIYGNGKQVRDILYVSDLVNAYDLVIKNIQKTKGKIYNIGGGAENTLSVWAEFKPKLEKLLDKKIPADYSEWRVGDQPIFIADIRRAKKDFGWYPKINVNTGLKNLKDWILDNKSLFKEFI